MRAIVLTISVFTAACSGQGPYSPTSPTGTAATLTRTERPGGSVETHAQNGYQAEALMRIPSPLSPGTTVGPSFEFDQNA